MLTFTLTANVGEKYVVELSNATLTTQRGFEVESPDISVTVDRAEFRRVILGETSLPDLAAEGTAQVVGDLGPLKLMLDALVEFDLLFEMMPGTAQRQ